MRGTMLEKNFNNATLELVKYKMKEELTTERYNLFINNLKLQKVNNDTIVLITDKHFNIEILEKNYKSLILSMIHEITQYTYKLEFTTEKKEEQIKKTEEDDYHDIKLNPKYSFEEYVESSCNNVAVKAAKVIAENNSLSAGQQNMLMCFIYGGVGLGKTHLLQAIGNYVKNTSPSQNVIYVTCEQFVMDYVNSIQNKSINIFRKKYRSCDVLLIDDIQFLQGKESTQEELFSTFNHLYENNKRIVFTSDKKPQDLDGIENRLISRFAWGLTTDIQPPNFEARLAIIDKKLEKVTLSIPDNVRVLIANTMKNNIRELEGCLRSFVQTCVLTGAAPTLKLAEEVISKIVNESNTKKVTIFEIKTVVADYYKVPIEDIDKKKRTKDVALARQVGMYIARKITDMSLPKLGEQFGGRDHSTVSIAIRKINELIRTDESISKDIERIIEKLE